MSPHTQGTVLASRYIIQSMLGTGGMGSVYLAHQQSLGKEVAVKEMRHLDADGRALEQFQQEARLLAQLDHPNLVSVLDYFEEAGRYYLVMAYLPGQNLWQRLQTRQKPFPPAQVVEWARQICDALTYLHGRNILFRDLKPANLMLDEHQKIRLIDFGIARRCEPGQATATFLQGMGSAGYAPPEQYQGAGGTDPRSDLYGLGATMYALLTGKAPPTPLERLADQEMLAARDLNPAVPAALSALLKQMLELARDQRPSSAAEVRTRLEGMDNHQDVTEALEASPQLAYLSEGGREHFLPSREVVLGRQGAHLIFAYPQVSRQHLKIVRGEAGYTVQDLSSRFGTFLNGKALGVDPVALQDGDELVLGGVLSLHFHDPAQTRGGKRVGRLKGVWLDEQAQEVYVDGQLLVPPLSPAQLTLLRLLDARTGSFVNREEVVRTVWPDAAGEGISEEAVDGLIKRVRARLREAGRDLIEVRRGQGLRLLPS
ncbi:protein kinase [bacterium]|nr:protein kinase [bacterium]